MVGEPWVWIAGALILLLCVAGVAAWAKGQQPRRTPVERARRLFHLQRERLEFRFVTLAQGFNPRGLELADCDFEDEVSFARDRHNGALRAYVAVTVRFRAIEGGGMEDNPNVSNLRAGCAEFRLAGSDWGTDGRVHFNVNPVEAINRYRQELEMVE